MGLCRIHIKKNSDGEYVFKNSTEYSEWVQCPTTEEYNKYVKGVKE